MGELMDTLLEPARVMWAGISSVVHELGPYGCIMGFLVILALAGLRESR